MQAQIATWVLLVAFALAFVVAVGAGGALAIRAYYANPVKAAELLAALGWIARKAALKYLPRLMAHLLKRMDPATEAAWRECQLRGGKWNHNTRRCE